MSKQPIYQIIRHRAQHKVALRHSVEANLGRLGIGFLASVVVSMLLLVVVGGLLFAFRTDQYPRVDILHVYFDADNGTLLQPTEFYDRSGKSLLYSLAPTGTKREFLPYEDFSPELLRVTAAATDPGYWSNMGFDKDSIPSLLVERLLIPSGSDDQLMRFWLIGSLLYSEGKEQTLAWYLNSSTYGMNTIGAEQAAQMYLGKSAKDLSLAEAALLVGVQQSPALNPFDALSAALENKDLLLNDLLEQALISQEEYQQALKERIIIQPVIEEPRPLTAVELAMETLTLEIPSEKILLGGYRIILTIDADLQEQSVCVINEQLQRVNDPEHEIKPELLDRCPAARFLTVLPPGNADDMYNALGASILLDPKTGQVLALMEQDDLNFEIANLPQQPGTSLAPFVALTGFSHGESPASLRWDIPAGNPPEAAQYLAKDHVYDGPMRSREAVVQQDALVLAEWMAELGESEVVRFSQTTGLHSLQDEAASSQLLFQGGDIPMLEQASALAVFANLGIQRGVLEVGEQFIVPQLILNVFAPGDELILLNCTTAESQTLVGSDLAYLVHDVLSDEVLRRSEYGYPNALSIGHPVGGLLASSDGGQQRWALGYTAQLVAGVWMGSDTGDILPMQTAGNAWHALMTYALLGQPAEGWETPDNIISMTVCSPSGLLPTTACQQLVSEIFIQGNQPVQLDDLYQSFGVNRETGRLATVFTPLALVDERIFLVVPPEAQLWAQENGLPVPPVDYDTIQNVKESPYAYFIEPENFSYISGQVDIRGTAAGADFESYTLQIGEGLNPKQWIVIQEESDQAVRERVLGVWDTTGYEGLYALRLVVERDGQQLESTLLQVTVDNTPPEMTILSPQPEEILSANANGEVVLQVHPEDNLGISVVRWIVDGKEFAQRKQSPFTVFMKLAEGDHVLEVEVEDQAGNITRSAPLLFSIED